eukprot:3351372-Amphidinium_carterae.2
MEDKLLLQSIAEKEKQQTKNADSPIHMSIKLEMRQQGRGYVADKIFSASSQFSALSPEAFVGVARCGAAPGLSGLCAIQTPKPSRSETCGS